jgi:hypothetical protein
MRGHYGEFIWKFLPRLNEVPLDGGLHDRVVLGSAYVVDLEEGIEEHKSGAIGKSVTLDSFVDVILGCEPAYDETVLEKIHAFGPHALVIAHCG